MLKEDILFKFEGISVGPDGKVMVKLSQTKSDNSFRNEGDYQSPFEVPYTEWLAVDQKIKQAATTLKNSINGQLPSDR